MENPVTGPAPSRAGGGHGLRGIADRARLLGGTATAGPAAAPRPGSTPTTEPTATPPPGSTPTAGAAPAQTWRLHARLPMKGPV